MTYLARVNLIAGEDATEQGERDNYSLLLSETSDGSCTLRQWQPERQIKGDFILAQFSSSSSIDAALI